MNWILKRAARTVLTILLVVHFSFLLIHFLPGSPMDYLQAQLAQQQGFSEGQIEAMAQTYLNMHPEQTLWEQYVDYMSSLATGSLGTSIYYNEPVNELLGTAIPWTVFLMLNAIAISFTIGISLGALMAYLEGTKFDNVTTVLSIVSNSIPYYIIAILLVYIVGHQWGWFPVTGRYDDATTPGANLEFIRGVIHHMTLPVLSWAFAGLGGWALAMRANSISILGEDYLRVGRLRGLPTHRLTLRYVARNAILPLYTNMMVVIGYAFGGAVVLETIFVYRGVGYYLFMGIDSRDYPLMMGGFIVITIAVVTALFLSELTYGKLDPRAQEGGHNESF